METLVFLCMAIAVMHWATVWQIKNGYVEMAREYRKIILEREETQRQMYTVTYDATTDAQYNANSDAFYGDRTAEFENFEAEVQ
tara:strand:+ start:1101 stop:1352 length:252 start_codon:yes stop_codon:yes gene_type:complete